MAKGGDKTGGMGTRREGRKAGQVGEQPVGGQGPQLWATGPGLAGSEL